MPILGSGGDEGDRENEVAALEQKLIDDFSRREELTEQGGDDDADNS